MGKTFSVHSLIDKKFKTYELSEEWQKAIGKPEVGFSMLIHGDSGQGKTTFCLKLTKEFSRFGKVYYNSFEQGESSSLQAGAIQCKLGEIQKGFLMFGHLDTFEEVLKKLRTNRAKFIFFDSLDYMNLTVKQFKFLKEKYPQRSFIVISWSEGKKPKTKAAQAINYMADIKIRVHKGMAIVLSRYGSTEPYQIFDTPFQEPKTKKKGLTLSIDFSPQKVG
ncbi:MAG: hypothetical protein COZ18_08390 [Flexibacter sp. CG_4_10_14_3_um_filter_32_15]|nr:MAG: hypothetical protein COZ18_08390 [Flexibacter sp. CG_4_10_14_3_um_filter_32_15]